MTATIGDRPAKCPHGTCLTHIGYLSTYRDGCRATPSGSPVRYWCGAGEMEKPNGVSVTKGEYLAAWDEALILNAGDDLYDVAARMNALDPRLRAWLKGRKAAEDARNLERDHAEALAEDERLTAETHPDTPEAREYLQSLYAPCSFRGLISKRPCTLADGHTEPHDVRGADAPKRQCCRKCLNTCIPAVTLTFDGGTRRLHWCEAHREDARGYVLSADDGPAVMALMDELDAAQNSAEHAEYLGEVPWTDRVDD
jgi:hypothetical protein